jgi:acetyltransferase-like isoleucine patch superfamily enzyme
MSPSDRPTTDDEDELHRGLTELYERLRADKKAAWQRDLPLGELLFDRWERARSLGFGGDSSVYHESYVYGDVTVGVHAWIGPFTLLDGSGGLTIGDYCVISAGVHIYSHDTVRQAVSGGRAPVERAPVRIGSFTHIGAQSTVLKGVTIGEHSVIGAGSIVNRDIPPYIVAVGNPCRPIGTVRVDDDGGVHFDYDGQAHG